MSTPSSDTSEDAAAAQRAAWARMGIEGKLLLTLQMSDDVRELAIEGELRRHPEWSRRQAELVVIRRMIGDELFEAAFGG